MEKGKKIFSNLFNKNEQKIISNDLESLRDIYSIKKQTAATERSNNNGEITQQTKGELKKLENEMVDLVPNKLEHDFLKIFITQDFDLENIFKAQDNGDWTTPIKNILGKINRFINQGYQDYQLPYSSKETLSWIMEEAASTPLDNKTPVVSVVNQISKSLESEKIFGKSFDELNIDQKTAEKISFVIVPAILNSDILFQFNVFAKAVSTIPEGLDQMKKMIETL